jgi:ABC-type transporter Mla maintaining outer membrane lipid asymmetry ATPase subunit MlaF
MRKVECRGIALELQLILYDEPTAGPILPRAASLS